METKPIEAGVAAGDGPTAESINDNRGICPPTAPFLPPPGPDLLAYAAGAFRDDTTVKKRGKKKGEALAEGDTGYEVTPGEGLAELVRLILREPGQTVPITVKPGSRQPVQFVPGHVWGEGLRAYRSHPYAAPLVTGPQVCRVLVLGKMLGAEEDRGLRNLVGPTGEVLANTLRALKIKGYLSWYVTNLVKFRPPNGTTTLRSEWVADGKYLLHHELRLVRPDFILCLGGDASKALLGPKHTVGYMDGRVVDYRYDVTLDPAAEVREFKTAQVMTVLHPAQAAREQTQIRVLERGLARFGLLLSGERPSVKEDDIDHRVVSTLADLDALLWEIDHDPEKTDRVIACDAEWHGDHPCNAGSYLRLFQFSWKPKCAACVVLRGKGGAESFFDADGNVARREAIDRLREWFADKRVVGHFFNADLEWLVAEGLDLRTQFAVPRYDADDGTSAWELSRTEGGADTGLMAHAVEETGAYGLEVLTSRYTTAPRYDLPMAEWCSAQKEKFGVLEGYGDAPDDLLVPYANYDADVTLRIFYALDSLLDCDYEGNCCREAFWETMSAAPAVLEIHQTGILVDKGRVDDLSTTFVEGRDALEQQIREWSRWPEFNIRSVFDVREFLFGTSLSGRLDREGNTVRKRPLPDKEKGVKGGRSLRLEPIYDTSKPPKLWAELVENEAAEGHTPATGKAVLSLLGQANPDASEQVRWVRDYRFLDQVLKSVLRPPKRDAGGLLLRDEDGFVYDKGLAACICDDGRVRTHIYQTKETGRWSSARPPLQNISKSRDPDYARLLGARYKKKLRSILKASPGHVLVEADYSGAELFGAAVMSGDETMIDHARRAALPDEGYDTDGNPAPRRRLTDEEKKRYNRPHPDYYDIHSNIAVLAFRLDCEPTKGGLKSIGKVHFRTLAKRVIFGMMYGQGARGSAMLAKEEGVAVTVEEAQVVIDTVFSTYPGLVPFFAECRRRATEERWLCHCFNRFRRFPVPIDEKTAGEFERQAMNFPIQGMIASCVNRAISALYYYRHDVDRPDLYRILLQIHDAVLLEVPCEVVDFVVSQVIPFCMRDRVPIYPTALDGMPLGTGPYYLGFGVEVAEHWGEPISFERCVELGIPTEYGHAA